MARFLCALHATKAAPRAFALVEQQPTSPGGEPSYVVRHLAQLPEDEPMRAVLDFVAREQQWAGRVLFVTTGGQRAADALREAGPSAAAVALTGDGTSAGPGVHATPAAALVNTFVRLFRDGHVEVPGHLDLASEAVAALYRAADLDAAAGDAERDEDDFSLDADAADAADGPAPAEVEQSGGAKALSTEEIEGRPEGREAMVLAAEFAEAPRLGLGAPGDPSTPPDLGEHADVATALALAVWFGEHLADDLPATDKADEALGLA
ncbi:MAG: hypothetical protein ACK41D_10580 [Rubricoccaceae bacterium]